jgi:hypothetical protein
MGAEMNPFDQLIAEKTPGQRREWLEPVKRNGRDMSVAKKRHVEANAVLVEALRRAMPSTGKHTISVDEWLRTMPPSESYQTRWGQP